VVWSAAAAPPPTPSPAPAEPVAVEAQAPRSRRILVVDDNVVAAKTLAMVLKYEGHSVQLAHDGPSALQAAGEERFDVVLMDIGLPGMTGYEVARLLRARPDLARLPLVAVTGYAEDEARRLSHEAGFDHHLVKPVDPDAILAVVASLP
jgi:two-component system CheB/CheR fusion protein